MTLDCRGLMTAFCSCAQRKEDITKHVSALRVPACRQASWPCEALGGVEEAEAGDISEASWNYLLHSDGREVLTLCC